MHSQLKTMEKLKEIAHISGKPGLFKILKPTRNGVIVETLDAAKKRMVVSGQTRISVLNDISLYLEDHQESTLPFDELFKKIHEKYQGKMEFDPKKASDEELFAEMGTIVPNYDQEKVYSSDIKKILSWYKIIHEFIPEAF